MRSERRSRLILAFLLLAALPAAASTFIVTDDELDPAVFPAVAESILANLDGANAPLGMSPAKRQRVERSLARIQEFLDDDPVRHATRIRNEQVRVNRVLAPQVASPDGRRDVVCQRIKPVGSHIPTTRCRDRQTIEEEQYAAQEEVYELKTIHKNQ
jgi:hypothetical protein